jgi:hypothetical protein
MSRHVSVLASLACNYLSTASLIVCSLTIVPIAIRQLGDVGYGTWLGLTALAAVGSMADMGVSGVLVVRLSRALEQARHGEAWRGRAWPGRQGRQGLDLFNVNGP